MNQRLLLNAWLYSPQITIFIWQHQNTFKHNYEIQESHQTRQSNLLFIERSKSVFASQLPYYTFPIMWNKWINKIPEYTLRNNLKNWLKNTLQRVIFFKNLNAWELLVNNQSIFKHYAMNWPDPDWHRCWSRPPIHIHHSFAGQVWFTYNVLW